MKKREQKEIKKIIKFVKDKSKELFKELGIGYAEEVYQNALEVELKLSGIKFSKEVTIPVYYKEHFIGNGRADFVVMKGVIVELKAQRTNLTKKEIYQIMKYMKPLNIEKGVIINFNQHPNKQIEIVDVEDEI